MRLIDADELVQALHKAGTVMGQPHFLCRTVYECINNAPIVDAVPVIRCRDCRWWDNSEDSPFGYCMAMKHGYMSENWEIGIYRRYKGDFYCADAERKDDES